MTVGMKDAIHACLTKVYVLFVMQKVRIKYFEKWDEITFLIRAYNILYIFHFLHSIDTLTDGNGTPLQSKKNFHSTDKSPFQRYYTKSGAENNRKDVSQTRSSIRHFDMSSPLRLLRRSCPQSPQLPQSSIQQGTYVLMLYLKK